MKKHYVLVDRKIWDGDPEYNQLLGIIEDNPNILLYTKIEGVGVWSEELFIGMFNKGKITSRKYELFIMECD